MNPGSAIPEASASSLVRGSDIATSAPTQPVEKVMLCRNARGPRGPTAIGLAFLALSSGCSSEKATQPSPQCTVSAVAIAGAPAAMTVGLTATLTSSVTATNCSAADVAATWTSSTPTVATITPSGVVTAVAAGSTTITLTVHGTAATAQILVRVAVASVQLTPPSVVLGVGGTAQLTATARDAAGNELTDRSIDFSSSNSTVASVSSTGVVSGVAAGGPVTIQAASEGKTASAAVTVVSGFTGLATAKSHTCGLVSGDAYCWGGNEVGQLGDGSTQDRTVAAKTTGGLKFTTLGLAHFGACGLTAAGAAYCWGDGMWGQRGDGTTTRTKTAPVAVIGGHTFTTLSAGGDYFNAAPLFVLDDAHVCGLDAAGAAWCWGANRWGELGRGTTSTLSSSPAQVTGAPNFVAISSGAYHNCGLTAAGEVWCWGYNAQNQLGRPTTTGFSAVPLLIPGAPSFASIALGDSHSCGLTAAGVAFCWGYNLYGQLGIGTSGTATNTPTPTPVAGGLTFRRLASADSHTCGLTTAGEAWCWGDGASGRLGNGTTTASLVPTRVTGGLNFTSLVTHDFHSCGSAADGRTYCWGSNSRGQLGDGTTSNATSPRPVLPPVQPVDVAGAIALLPPPPAWTAGCVSAGEMLAGAGGMASVSAAACYADAVQRENIASKRALMQSPGPVGRRPR